MDPQQPQDQANDTNPFDQFYSDQPNDQPAPETPQPQDVPAPAGTPTPVEPTSADVLSTPPLEPPVAQTPPAPAEPLPAVPTQNEAPPPPPPSLTSTEGIFETKPQITTAPTLPNKNPYAVARMHMTVRKILLGIIIFVIMIIVGLTAALFASGQLEELTTPLTKQLYRLPFFPKTTEYVLDQMAAASLDITSFSYDFSAGFDVSDQQFDLAADGKLKLDATGAAEEFEFNGRLKTTAVPYTGEMAFNIIGITNGLYLRLHNITGGLNTFAQYLPPIDQWYFVDLEPLTTQARTALQQNGGTITTAITPLPQQLQRSIQKLLSTEGIKEHITLGENEKLSDGSDVYRLTLKPTSQMIADYIIESAAQNNDPFTPDEIASLRQQTASIRQLDIDAWVDTSTYYVRKAQVAFTYDVDSTDLQHLVPMPTVVQYPDSITGVMVIELSNINMYTPVTIPPVVRPIDEYLQVLSEAIAPLFGSDAQDGNMEIQQTFELEPPAEDAFSF